MDLFDLFPSLSTPVPALLEELRSGTAEVAGDAFNLLQAEVASAVEAQAFATVRRNVGCTSLRKQIIEEALAETWLAVIKDRRRFTGNDLDSLRKWVCGIARNKCLQMMRNTFGRRECELQECLDLTGTVQEADAVKENVDLKNAMDKALSRACRTEKQRLLAIRVLEAHVAGCSSSAEAYREAALAGESEAWIKEVWLDVRSRLRADPSLSSLADRPPAPVLI